DPALLGPRAAPHAAAGALAQGRALRRPRRHALLARCPPARRRGLEVVESGTCARLPTKEIRPMATERPLVVLAGPIHPDGRALLEKEARVVVCEDETEAGLVKAAAEAHGILFRIRPTSRDNPILNLPNVVCSSHMAGVTREATRQAAMQVSGEMLRVLRGERPDVLVNPDVWARLGRR